MYQPPEGGLVLYVTWKVLGDHSRTDPPRNAEGPE